MRAPILFPLGSRANWSSVLPIGQALAEKGVDFKVVAFGSAVLDRYGGIEKEVSQAFAGRIESYFTQVEGTTPSSSGKTIAQSLMTFIDYFSRERPSVVHIVGDRHEMLAPTVAARCVGITISHSMGGERSGTMDDRTRDAISSFADLHFAATQKAAERLKRFVAGRVYDTGCPRLELVRNVWDGEKALKNQLLACYHPDNPDTAAEEAHGVVSAIVEAQRRHGFEVVWIWPNADAGSDAIVRELRHAPESWRFRRLCGPVEFSRELANSKLVVGNSSSFIREGSWTGTPAVMVGTRQAHREHGPNAIYRQATHKSVLRGIEIALSLGHVESVALYGDGTGATQIAEHLRSYAGS